MNSAIERRWISYDWFKLIVALILIALLLLFRLAASTDTTGVTPATSPPAVATAASSAQIAAPVLVSPASGTQAAPGPMTFSGTAAPGVELQLLVDGVPAGKARAGADGTWTLNATLDKPGAHPSRRAQCRQPPAVGPAGRVSAPRPAARARRSRA